MIELSVVDFVLVFAVVLFTAFVQSVVGFGFALLAVPMLIQVIDLQPAVILSSLIGTSNNIFQFKDLRKDQDSVQVKRFLYASFIGAPAGLAVFLYANQDALKIILGCGILFGVVLLARGRDLSEAHVGLDWAMGIISGVLLTSTSTNGPPLVFALQARRSPPEVFRATLNMIFLVSGLYGIALFALFGEIAVEDVLLAIAVLPAMVVGVLIGRVARKRIDPLRFRTAVLLLLCFGALSSIYGGLVG
jgi:uncharacterized membrane protein YfcA